MSDAATFRELVREAVRIVGGQPTLARMIGKSQQHVSKLCTTAEFISGEDAMAIHGATGGKIAGSALRPDLWLLPEHVPLYTDAPTRHEQAVAS